MERPKENDMKKKERKKERMGEINLKERKSGTNLFEEVY